MSRDIKNSVNDKLCRNKLVLLKVFFIKNYSISTSIILVSICYCSFTVTPYCEIMN